MTLEQTVTCDDCGVELHIGDFPFCPHGRIEGGMLGEFHEYDDAFSFGEPTRITSLAQRNRLEKEHGLCATSPNDPRLSVNEIARRALAHEQSRPENVRAREAAIRDALQRQRR